MASEMAKAKTSSSVFQMSTSSNPEQGKSLFTAQVALRISAIVFTLIAIPLILTNHQSVIVSGFKFEAHYTYSTAFKFLVGANVVVCAFSALSLIFVSFFLSRSAGSLQQQLRNYYLLFLHDTMMMVMMISGSAAATAIGYVGKYGEKNMTWQPTCDYVSEFCSRMSISIAFSYLAFVAYLFLTLLSAHTLMPRSAA